MKIARILLQWFCNTFPIRGRHRLANTLGNIFSPAKEEIINIHGIAFPIDHSLEMYRYVYYGMYEENFVRLLKRIIKAGDVVIEPGANVGILPLYYLH